MNEDMKAAAETAVIGGGLGGLAGLLRGIVFADHQGGWAAYVSIVAAACTVGAACKLVLSAWQIDGSAINEGIQWAVVIVSSIVAKDILTGLRAMGSQFAVDPLALVQRVWKAIRGQ